MGKVLLIEDDVQIQELVRCNLEKEGLTVVTASDGNRGLDLAGREKPDLIILDLTHPAMDSYDVCKMLRAQKDTSAIPIIILSARDDVADKVIGLELGADDYVTKPFSPFELRARVKALLRRSEIRNHQTAAATIQFGPFELDPSKYLFTKNSEPIQLTTIEFALMKLLMQHAGHVLKRDDILSSVWGEEVYVTPRTVDTHIANLRKKIEDDPEQSHWITGIRGAGYKFSSYESSPNLNPT